MDPLSITTLGYMGGGVPGLLGYINSVEEISDDTDSGSDGSSSGSGSSNRYHADLGCGMAVGVAGIGISSRKRIAINFDFLGTIYTQISVVEKHINVEIDDLEIVIIDSKPVVKLKSLAVKNGKIDTLQKQR